MSGCHSDKVVGVEVDVDVECYLLSSLLARKEELGGDGLLSFLQDRNFRRGSNLPLKPIIDGLNLYRY